MERDLSTFVRTCLLPVSGFHTGFLVGGGDDVSVLNKSSEAVI